MESSKATDFTMGQSSSRATNDAAKPKRQLDQDGKQSASTSTTSQHPNNSKAKTSTKSGTSQLHTKPNKPAPHFPASAKSFLPKKAKTSVTKDNGNGANSTTSSSDEDTTDSSSSQLLHKFPTATSVKTTRAATPVKEGSRIYERHHSNIASEDIDSSRHSTPSSDGAITSATKADYVPLSVSQPPDVPAISHKRRMSTSDEVSPSPPPPVKKSKKARKPTVIPRREHLSDDEVKKARPGSFSHEEVANFESWKARYCNENNLTAAQLLARFNQTAHKSDKVLSEMYGEVYELFPFRNQAEVRKFARRNAGWKKRGAAWTPAEDDHVKALKAQVHPALSYQQIGEEIGRFHEDVRNRWRDKLQPALVNANRGPWTAAEVAHFYRVVATCVHNVRVAEARASRASGLPVRAEGTFLLEEDQEKICWQAVSDALEGRRSRVQCTQKWTALKKVAGHEGKMGEARDAVLAGAAAAP